MPSSDLTTANISLEFKDEYKIRLKVNKSKDESKKPAFKYLSDEHGDDDNNGVKYISNIIKKYNLTDITGRESTPKIEEIEDSIQKKI